MRTLIFLAMVVLPSMAPAASLDPVQLLRQFNLITTGDVNVQSLHVHGRALIGGGLTGNIAEINHDNIDSIEASDFDDLALGNATAGTQARVLNNGSASFTGTPGMMEASIKSSPARLPENFGTVLSDFSTSLAGKTANATADKTTLSNRITLGGALLDEIAVFDLVESDFMNREISLSLNGASAILVNVRSTDADKSFDLMSNFIGDKTVARNVIWNFIGFDTVQLDHSIYGQVLAKDAHVKLRADSEGSIFAARLTAQAQVHVQLLDFPEPPDFETPPAAVPLPAGLPMMLAGILAILGLRRQRSRQA